MTELYFDHDNLPADRPDLTKAIDRMAAMLNMRNSLKVQLSLQRDIMLQSQLGPAISSSLELFSDESPDNGFREGAEYSMVAAYMIGHSFTAFGGPPTLIAQLIKPQLSSDLTFATGTQRVYYLTQYAKSGYEGRPKAVELARDIKTQLETRDWSAWLGMGCGLYCVDQAWNKWKEEGWRRLIDNEKGEMDWSELTPSQIIGE